MDLKLTCNSYEKMADTNKLLYLLLVEVREIKNILLQGQTETLTYDSNQSGKQVNANTQEDAERSSQGKIETLEKRQGFYCKYCNEFVEGNRGDLLAHIRKCPKRT